MKSFKKIGVQPASIPVLADDILEFHAARLLLLLSLCGVKGAINGLTKMAKLDFFVRYPQFFETACEKLGIESAPPNLSVESAMVRYRYGPWDHRYYHILSYLEGSRLIDVDRVGKSFRLALTDDGLKAAEQLRGSPAFSDLVARMRLVKRALGNKSGSTLKKMIYDTFAKQVAERQHGEVIAE